MKILKKKILITGATSGLGKKLAIYFNKKNSLICVGQSNIKIEKLKKVLKNKNNKFYAADLSNELELNSFLNYLNKIKKIDTVIHCMGGGLGLKANLIKKSDFLKLFNVNLFSQSEINNKIIKKIIKEKISGNILHISSVAALESTASIGYSTAKAALTVYSKKLAKLYIKKKIFIKTIILGAFETSDNSFARLKKNNLKAYNNFKNIRLPRKKFANPNDIIPLVEFLLSKDSNILSGSDVVADFSETNTFRN
tara:strand:+ start:151 stop:909 length:759 start_codon:yes stop_codon:yes gene_type:complete